MKRIFDILITLMVLLISAPLLLLIAIVVMFDLGRPVLFRQKRVGKGGKIFHLRKFRTMSNKTDANGHLLPDAQRLTKFGQLIRKLSIDELPELINVLKGEMSLVGPRPLLTEYLPLYSAFQARRHEVKPGVTGWAQIKGRNSLTWDEKFALDVWYVDHQSFWLDLKILFLTAFHLLAPKGINAEGEVTMYKFTGNTTSTHNLQMECKNRANHGQIS